LRGKWFGYFSCGNVIRSRSENMSQSGPTRPTKETRDAERNEAEMRGQADRMPTAEEEEKADEHELDPEVAEHEREMAERGAKQKGEGRIP
jgi:hypothetical protein